MSDNALRNRPPSNWRGELAGAEDASGVEGIDLKMNGSVPFVDGARIFALATGVTATNTVERLRRRPARRRASPSRRSAPGATPSSTYSCCGCASSTARVGERRAGARQSAQSQPACRSPSSPTLDRRILKEAMRQVRKLQQRLELDYPG